jgi:catechol 2,3-dioxygenase-like lactoylglutathione lyase family enzyme
MLTGLDHIILGIADLDRGVAWLEQRTGVRAIFGGVHPGRGTRNALIALGPSSYLEILAPDPQQSSPTWFTQIPTMSDPRLIAWAVHTPDLTALAQAAVAAGFPIDGPHDGVRSRPDGKVLSWKLFHLRDDRGGLLPFFIEWGRDSVHPAADAPSGCTLERFHLQSPDAQDLARACQALAVEVAIEPGAKPLMLARIASPKGEVELTS